MTFIRTFITAIRILLYTKREIKTSLTLSNFTRQTELPKGMLIDIACPNACERDRIKQLAGS